METTRPSTLVKSLPPDIFIYSRTKREFLGGQLYKDDEVKTAVMNWTSSHVADFLNIGVQKLVERCDKCLNKMEIMQKRRL
ncbi:hypothetical protein NPIL_444031 [Nephila pilipes]|uniref:Uncharacterized protein n=1 Tax=Nephila pilipes TaxID=299642 RepID=A0A8X6R226_NEPPI|nr:hypothetical protein NPIL_444031 [Nephila pilipes]